ncbi:hypothetical protein KI387_023041 [Taxus chinensis]|uniref:DUF7392 domain-containing protein n=1 Tax=Taxus chinensis TaxID=29808 RepID=A0AA38G429_TAXCH|nr:hypothetical protein KI387_023041 [Taxus chinensis]
MENTMNVSAERCNCQNQTVRVSFGKFKPMEDTVAQMTKVAAVTEKNRNVRVSFAIFEPEGECDINDAVAHMTKVAAVIEKSSDINVAIIKCLDNLWAAVFIVWKGEGLQNAENSALNLPQAAAFTKGLKCAVRTVDSGWFQPSSQQTSRGIPFAQLSLGDIVSIRRIYCSGKRQDVLSYSCLAILRSYFDHLEGIISCSFYDSLDGKQIIGLGVWDGIESASVLVKHPDKSPGLTYWKDMVEKELKYHVCQGADRLEKDIKTCVQALDPISFVQNCDSQYLKTINLLNVIDNDADIICMVAYNDFKRLLKLHKQVLDSLNNVPNSSDYVADDNMAWEAIENILKDVERQLNIQKLLMVANKVEGHKENVGVEDCDPRDSKYLGAITIYSTTSTQCCELI